MSTHARINYSAPSKGYVLSTAVEEIALPVRLAVLNLQKCTMPGKLRKLMNVHQKTAPNSCTEAEAWRIISICLVSAELLQNSINFGPNYCIQWFYGDDKLNVGEMEAILFNIVSAMATNAKIRDLLPYIIDAHGPGSRLSVQKSPETAKSRARKKASGVFYTPSDVADFMIKMVLPTTISPKPPTFLDPAVGTGVFLRSALMHLKRRYPKISSYELACHFLHGSDIDSFSLDAAAFVLLHDVISDLPSDAPNKAWIRLRANLANIDGLLLDKEDGSLERYFPSIKGGADIIIGNPPYAHIGARADLEILAKRFKTLASYPKTTADLYPIFIEQLVRLGRIDSSGSMVVPLSLACNSGKQFRACRELIAQTTGVWRFAFFDREPHALFGEDVKTRNTIIIRNFSSAQSHRIMTGPLRRWRGNDRATLFANINFTDLQVPVIAGIPKVNDETQSQALKFFSNSTTIKKLIVDSGKVELCQLPNAHKSIVMVGATAYNFLNVSRATILPISAGEQLSQNALHQFSAANEEAAAAVYALLVSDFAFWWWHINGDGFHVNLSHLLMMPIGNLSKTKVVKLARLGRQLWNEARKSPLKSINRGSVSYSFAARSLGPKEEVDAILRHSIGLPEEFANSISSFISTTVDARLFLPHNSVESRNWGNE